MTLYFTPKPNEYWWVQGLNRPKCLVKIQSQLRRGWYITNRGAVFDPCSAAMGDFSNYPDGFYFLYKWEPNLFWWLLGYR